MSSPAKETRPHLSGVIAAMLTPMRDAGTRVDAEAATRLVSWLVDRGVHGLYVAGTTGEGLYLSPDEHRELAQAVVKAARGVPVVVHVGALTTAQAVALARQAVQVEATAVASPTPSSTTAAPSWRRPPDRKSDRSGTTRGKNKRPPERPFLLLYS